MPKAKTPSPDHFDLSATMPSGLTASFGSSSLSLSPGSSGSTAVQVSSSTSLSAGSYNFTVKGTNIRKMGSGAVFVSRSLSPALAWAREGLAERFLTLTCNRTVGKKVHHRFRGASALTGLAPALLRSQK